MRKFICLLLSIITLLSVSSCGDRDGSNTLSLKPTEPTTLTIVVEETAELGGLDKAFKNIYGENYILEFIELSSDPAKREPQLANLRAEIMSGAGPDIYMLPTWSTLYVSDDLGNEIDPLEPLFPDMVDAMNNRLFLPLDEFIKASENFNLDDHVQIVMDAGKTDDGQVVLPLLYSFPFILNDKSGVRDPELKISSLKDLLICNDEPLIGTAMSFSDYWISSLFTDFVDINTGDLVLTEEEISETFAVVGRTYSNFSVTDETTLDVSFREEFGWVDLLSVNEWTFYTLKNYADELYPLTIYNNHNGITAQVTAFIAINSNTEKAEHAFKFIDMLYRSEIQSGKGVYVESDGKTYGSTIFPNPDLCSSQGGIPTGYPAYDIDEIYDLEYLESLISQVNCVRYTSEIDLLIRDTWNDVSMVYAYGTGDKEVSVDEYVTKEIHSLYSKIKMLAAE